MKHYGKAYKKWEKAHELLPSRTTLFNLAFLNLHFARLDKAEAQFDILLNGAPQDPDLLVGTAVLEILKGRPKIALKKVEKIPATYRDRADIAIYRALALYEREALEKAYLQLSNHEYTTDRHLRSIADPLKKQIAQTLEAKRIEEKKKKNARRLPAEKNVEKGGEGAE